MRFLFLVGLGLVAVAVVRSLLQHAGPRGSLEPQFQRLEDFVEVLASDDAPAIAAARSALDRARIPTMVADQHHSARVLMVPSNRLDEARSVVAKRI